MLRTLTRKVTLAAVVFLALIAGAAAVVLTNIVILSSATTHLAEATTTRLELVGDFNTNIMRALLEVATYTRSRQEQDLDEGHEALTAAAANLARLEGILEERPLFGMGLEADYKPLEEQWRFLHTSVQQGFDAIVRAVESNDDAAIDRALSTLEALEDDAEQLEEDTDIVLAADIAQSVGAVTTRTQLGIASISGLVSLVVLLMLLAVLLLHRQIVRPARRLANAAGALAAGNREHVVRVTSNDEIGDLQRTFNSMATTIQHQTASLEQQVAAAQAARAEAEAARAETEAQLTTITEQQNVIRDMSVPILPLTDAALVMPLVGALDSARLHLIQAQALQALERSGARYLILDITGVSMIDTQVAQGLLQVVQAAQLLGTEVILVGIRPEVAQSLVGLGIHFNNVKTRSTLQRGIAYVLQVR
jgi:rsbT co-antagonist protein RsbR